jgi:bla regulator protein BlaR1
MGTFFYGISNMFPHLLDHSVEISLLICLIFMAKMMAPKRLPAWWHYCLWLMLLVRMLVPVEFENRLNLFNFVPEVQAPHVSEFIVESPVEATELVTQQVVREAPPQAPPLQMIVKKILPVVWLAGAMLLSVCILFESISFWLSVRRRPAVTDEEVLALLSECKARMKIRRNVDVIVTDTVRSPALFGYFRPRILLPEGVFEKLDEKELSYAFMHELGHLKRHDIGVSWLVTVLQVIHWFNPLVWLAFYQLRIDQESACDAAVLVRMKPKQSAEYAKAIVGFLEKFCQNCQLPSLAGVLENRTQMKKRLSRIVQYRKTTLSLAVFSLVLLSSTALALFSLTGVAAHTTVDADMYESIQGPGNFPERAAENTMLSLYGNGPGQGDMDAGFNVSVVAGPLGAETDEMAERELPTLPEAVAASGSYSPLSEGDMGAAQYPNEDERVSGSPAAHVAVSVSRSEKTVGSPLPGAEKNGVPVEQNMAAPGGAVGSYRTEMNGRPSGTEKTELMASSAYVDTVPNTKDAVSTPNETAGSGGPEPIRAVASLESPSAVSADNTVATGDGLIAANHSVTPVSHPEAAPLFSDSGSISGGTLRGSIQNQMAGKAPTVMVEAQQMGAKSEPFQAVEVDTPPSVIKSYPPRYPYLAKRDDISGSVVLQFVVTKDGNAVGTTVVESQPEGIFDETALQAIEQYRFKPGLKDGKAVDVKVHLPIKFTLS